MYVDLARLPKSEGCIQTKAQKDIIDDSLCYIQLSLLDDIMDTLPILRHTAVAHSSHAGLGF